jgi:S-adenosylmethionine:tRNA ribosyltransferase-isomerase
MLQIKALLRYFVTMQTVNLSEYTYELPDEKIARYPLQARDQSKLLVYEKGTIRHLKFGDLSDNLPANSILFFNDTRVIPARLLFRKPSGAPIEVLLLSPVAPSPVMSVVMAAHGSCTWACTIGNQKRWPEGLQITLNAGAHALTAELIDRAAGLVRFTWSAQVAFATVLEKSGVTPLPPYLRREAEETDRHRYQTIYSQHEGAVAAPTAGLHFTNEVFEQLKERGIAMDFLTLHVSAGTFLPVKERNAALHVMHGEQVAVSRTTISYLLDADKLVIPVGTTSMRTLESLYWYAVRLLQEKDAEFVITQHDPYRQNEPLPTPVEAFQTIAGYMDDHQLSTLNGRTSIYILPGYAFRVCKGLITNFHQPGSTLLLLIAAFAGEDWKSVYREALANDYRFLSYGDSSLLLPGPTTSGTGS